MIYGMGSIFETIFARELMERGYEIEKNVIIGMFEYDVVVKGRLFQPYLPFKANSFDYNLTEKSLLKAFES
jgi:hypothetical protein